MKKLIILFAFLGLIMQTACSQKSNDATPKKVDAALAQVLDIFVKSGDAQDVAQLETVLHPDYRVTVNQFMGGEGVTMMSRADYLGLMRDKKIGGQPRTYAIKAHQIVQHTAQVHLHMESKELIFDNFLILVQDKSGKWTVISDGVVAKPNQ